VWPLPTAQAADEAYFGRGIVCTFGDESISLSFATRSSWFATRSSWNLTLSLDGHVLWDRSEKGGFPDHTEVKQRARDRLDPAKNLGLSDIKKPQVEDEAADARKFFGVL
jgi:predicted Rdx family selenoprotein